jgi:hypothetical protein
VLAQVFGDCLYKLVHEEEGEVCGPGGGAARVEALGVQPVGAVVEMVVVYISNVQNDDRRRWMSTYASYTTAPRLVSVLLNKFVNSKGRRLKLRSCAVLTKYVN